MEKDGYTRKLILGLICFYYCNLNDNNGTILATIDCFQCASNTVMNEIIKIAIHTIDIVENNKFFYN